jgi:hypothetical protein
MELKNFMIAILLFSLFLVGGSFLFEGMVQSYNISVTSSEVGFNDTQNIINDMYKDTDIMKNNSLKADVEGEDETTDSLIKGAYKAIKLVPNSVRLINVIIQDISKEIGIPLFITTTFITIIFLITTFGVIYLIFRFKG